MIDEIARPLFLALGAVLLVLDLALSIALAAASGLSRLALHRLGSENDRYRDLFERLREIDSVHGIAAHILRQSALLVGTACLAHYLALVGSPRALAVASALGIGVGVLVVESVLARAIALWDPRRALRATAFVLRGARFVLYPLAAPLHGLLSRAERLPSGTDEQREDEQEEEVDALIEVGEREGLLEGNEGRMMRSIVELDETAVREIMTPRPDIVALPDTTTVAEARRIFLDAGHSRLPVYRRSIDEVLGILHVRDLLRALDLGHDERSITEFVREPMFVGESRSVAELLTEMRVKAQMAVVVDEYGGTAGLVTLEDLLEEIVGEIRDEHDEEPAEVRQEATGSWLISAGAHVEKLTDLFGVEFAERDFDTVGGLVVSVLGRVPRRGETVDYEGIRIEVLDVERRRILLVRVRPQPTSVESAQVGT